MSNTKLKIREIRNSKGIKAKEIAEKMGVSQQRFSNWERGTREMNFLEAISLAEILECSLDELAGREWPPSVSESSPSDPALVDIEDAYHSMNGSGKTALHMVAQSLSRDPTNSKKDIGASPQARAG